MSNKDFFENQTELIANKKNGLKMEIPWVIDEPAKILIRTSFLWAEVY